MIEKPKAEVTEEAKDSVKKVPNGITKETSFTREEEAVDGHQDERRPSVVTAIVANNGVDGNDIAAEDEEDDDPPLPPGFPNEDDFDTFVCYKCVEAFPWIRRYAGTAGFLSPVHFDAVLNSSRVETASASAKQPSDVESKKRKAIDDEETLDSIPMAAPKRQKSEDPVAVLTSIPETMSLPITPKKQGSNVCKYAELPPPPSNEVRFSLFMKPDFRDHLCRCSSCFPRLKTHPQLLEEEENYEPPISEDGDGAPSAGTGSIYDRGEAAFSTMDRARAIQGAMAYAHLKDNLKAFLQPFAESGQAVGAEDIKAYFEKLRGDEKGIKEAAGGAAENNAKKDSGDGGSEGGSQRKEQSGY